MSLLWKADDIPCTGKFKSTHLSRVWSRAWCSVLARR